ncbi:Glyco_hydro_17 domain-containing protein/X8 domain-containing protein [Cephalotus follicularis]|uniref:glucan endo-1,3-beta-D-glucosidase n=1 Tax=Cephalotus follicularis TaxID=3775 RepID=A0A1Q3CRN0_CEPFO|nr:Glyco_hydro_17 domain-containing protein/X8 domain-containing protein [Cephalotus follicularis]
MTAPMHHSLSSLPQPSIAIKISISFCFFFAMVTGILLLLASTVLVQGVQGSIGVNYGTIANNLPPPRQVARFLSESTIVNRVRLFDADPDIIQAFAHTGIGVTVTVPNDQIPHLTKLNLAQQWVNNNIIPYIPDTNVVRILVGNEVLSTANKLLITSLVPAMQTLHTAIVRASLEAGKIEVSTPHSLGILASSSPPSTGIFRQGYDTHVLKPLLSFLRSTNSPFMINPYPFFGCSADTLDYALFRPNPGVFDEDTKLTYTNMLDAQLDAVYSAIKLLGFTDIEIVIAETGWPSNGDPTQVGVDAKSAAEYNGNLLRHVTSGDGTPLMPNRTFETYIFALFNENLKPGPTCERNFGLFKPDMTPVYDIGILRPTANSSIPMNPTPAPVIAQVRPVPGSERKQWCLPKFGAETEALQRNIDYVCGLRMVDCRPIQEDGPCFLPNTVRAHAAYAMNAFYQATERNDYDCDFQQTGTIANVDPSYGNCHY